MTASSSEGGRARRRDGNRRRHRVYALLAGLRPRQRRRSLPDRAAPTSTMGCSGNCPQSLAWSGSERKGSTLKDIGTSRGIVRPCGPSVARGACRCAGSASLFTGLFPQPDRRLVDGRPHADRIRRRRARDGPRHRPGPALVHHISMSATGSTECALEADVDDTRRAPELPGATD